MTFIWNNIQIFYVSHLFKQSLSLSKYFPETLCTGNKNPVLEKVHLIIAIQGCLIIPK